MEQTINQKAKLTPPSQPIGEHLTAEFWNCKTIEDEKTLETILVEAAKQANSMPLKVCIHKFEPQGATGFAVLAESHLSFHSWPEFNYVAIDAFTCGTHTIPQKAIDYLQKQFEPKEVIIQEVQRGIKHHTASCNQEDLTIKQQVFGQELVLNLFDCNPEPIRSGNLILEFIDKLCVLIDMKKYGKPFLERFAEHSEIAAGYSVAQMIETSQIAGHFSEYWNNAYLNIFSCKPFDSQVAQNFAKEFFGAKKVKAKLLIR